MSPLFLQAEVDSPGVATFVRAHWPILLAAALGAVAAYLLLPRPRRYPPLYGVFAGLLALFVVGWVLIRPEPAWVETVLFYAFAALAVLAGGLMITLTQPVHAALSFAVVVLATCGLFLLQAAPFLMAATIIIYAGAIVVTFLFVIMLAQQSGLDSADYRSREPLLASVAGFVLLAAVLCVLHSTYPEGDSTEVAANLDPLLHKIDQARQAASVKRINEILKDPEKIFLEVRKYADVLRNQSKKVEGQVRDLRAASDDASAIWAVESDDPEVLREKLTAVYESGRRLQNALHGTLQPAAKLKDDKKLVLSAFSGTPANEVPPTDAAGRARMPAENVAALGRSLFTDYLLAVELAATVLLVATIGAIVIAGRRAEGLR